MPGPAGLPGPEGSKGDVVCILEFEIIFHVRDLFVRL